MSSVSMDTETYMTALQELVGFTVAEEMYDQLTAREQIILDMLVMGYTHTEIGLVFDLKQNTLSTITRVIRTKLAAAKLFNDEVNELYGGNHGNG